MAEQYVYNTSPSSPDTNQRSVIPGRITAPDYISIGAMGPSYKEFQYNPNEITDSKEVNYASAAVAGASHPVYQFTSGGARTISFELFLSAESSKTRITKNDELDLTDEILWYRSLTVPMEYGRQSARTHPPIVIFSLGSLWRSVPCVIKVGNIKVTSFSASMKPLRAIVPITLMEVVKQNQVANYVLTGGA